MTRRALRVGIIGAGRIAQTYAAVLHGSEQAAAAGVADQSIDAARALASQLGCQAFDSHRALADAGGLDLAIVCTPPASHPDVVIDLVRHGVHVLCEKPFSIAPDAARAMLSAAQRAGVLLAMATKFRHTDGVIAAKHQLDSGALGAVRRVDVTFTAPVDMAGRWYSAPRISGGGVLMDNGPHAVDLLRAFLGPIAAVRAREGARLQNLGVDETIALEVRNSAGCPGSAALSWNDAATRDDYLTIEGTAGTISVGWRTTRQRSTAAAEWRDIAPGYDKLAAFRQQLANFCAAIHGREPLRANADDALASVEVIAAAYASLREGRWCDVPPAGLNPPSGPSPGWERVG